MTCTLLLGMHPISSLAIILFFPFQCITLLPQPHKKNVNHLSRLKVHNIILPKCCAGLHRSIKVPFLINFCANWEGEREHGVLSFEPSKNGVCILAAMNSLTKRERERESMVCCLLSHRKMASVFWLL